MTASSEHTLHPLPITLAVVAIAATGGRSPRNARRSHHHDDPARSHKSVAAVVYAPATATVSEYSWILHRVRPWHGDIADAGGEKETAIAV